MKEGHVPLRTAEVVQFVEAYIAEHGYSPTVREIVQGVGLSSPGSLQGALQQMIKLGYLRGSPTQPRTIRVGHMPLRPRTETM